MPYLLMIAALIVASDAQPPVYRTEVAAVLSRTGCNAGACHGNLNGKGGFRLSLRGEDPLFDHLALTRDMLGRRTDPLRPDESLILQKATGRVPHEGGIRFTPESQEYRILHDWIAAGCPDSDGPRPERLDVSPARQILFAPADQVQIKATAVYADGSRRDVTGLATFETTTVGVASMHPSGRVTKEQDGELVVIVRYLDHQVPVPLAFLPQRPSLNRATLPSHHPIDRHVFDQLAELRLQPSPVASDEVFIRRAYLDACGIVPTADEVRAFLTDRDPNKQTRLIDRLLARPEFAAFWAQKWSDLLRNEEKSLDRKGVQVFHRWIKNWIAEDRPLSEFAAEVLAARGSTYANPPANFYRSVRDPYTRAEAVAQVFLGLRVSCARCHNHPFDRWTQDDYHRFAAVFARIDYRVLENNRRDGLDKHEFIGEQIVLAKAQGELPHPRGGNAKPKFLGATADLGDDRLSMLADWIASPENPFFARAQANRIWLHLTGRGLVDPNDDFRATNPPSNPALLDHLTAEFIRGETRLRPLVRHIMTSTIYQLSSQPTATNAEDELHHSRARVQPLEAEQLLDALSSVFDRPVPFPGYPSGTRAGEVPAMPLAGRRMAEAPGTRFLKVFGKPERLLTCECERSEDAGMLQAFQLMTGELITDLLRDSENRIGRSLAAGISDRDLLDEFYLAALARYPSAREREELLAYLGRAENRRAAWEDVAWGLVNAKEFLLRR